MFEINRSLAIIIGIDKYQHITRLKNAVADADELARVLKDIYGYEVLLLLNQEATKEKLDELVVNLQNKTIELNNKQIRVDKRDRVLFYFAGHGLAEEAQDSKAGKPAGYFMPQDAEEKNKNTWLSMHKLYEAFSALDSHHLLMILDCCFAGRISWVGQGRNAEPSSKLYQQSYARFIKHKTEQIITSAAHDEKAQDLSRLGQRGEKNGHSPFAYLLLKVLQGNSDGGKDKSIEAIVEDKVITVHELFTYLQNKLGEVAGGQTPGLFQPQKYDRETDQYVYLKGEYIFPLPQFKPEKLEKFKLNRDSNPYKGLASFDTKDSHLFFGRKNERKRLAEIVNKQSLTIVLGDSGSGKSSLAKAGLIPTLEAKSNEQQWHILDPMRPGESPFKELNKILTQSKSGSLIIGLSLSKKIEILSKKFNNLAKRNLKSKLLLLIDQSEELLTLSRNRQERKDFLALLAELLNKCPQLRIVLTLRSDLESQLRDTIKDNHWQQAWQQGRFFVTPMNREELQEAIQQPAARRTLFFESPKLVNDLIDEAINTPGALPLLSFILSELYVKYLQAEENGERDDRTIREKDYLDLGGVEGSLAQAAKRTYRELEKITDRSTINNVMLRMVSLNGGEITRRRVPKSELDYPESINKDVEEIINRFVAARLFTTGKNVEDQEYVEPVHDALITGWTQIKYWLDEKEDIVKQGSGWNPIKKLLTASKVPLFLASKENGSKSDRSEAEKQLKVNLPLQREVNTSANNWRSKKGTNDNKKAVGFLWNADPRLDLLKQVLNSEDNWLNKVEAEFVQRSVARKVFNTRRNWSIAGTVALVIFTTAIIASVQWIKAQMQLISTINALTEASQELFDSNKEFDALLTSLRAGKQAKQTAFWVIPGIKPKTEYRINTQLQQAVHWVKERNRLEGHKAGVFSVSFSPNGKLLASASVDNTIKLWDAKTGKPIKDINRPETLDGHKNIINFVTFSPSGQLLASASVQEKTVKLWDINTGKVIHTFLGYGADANGSNGVSFSPNEKILAVASEGNIIKLWGIDTHKVIGTLKGHTGQVNGVSFSPNGRQLASASFDKTVKLWDIGTHKVIRTLKGHGGWVVAVNFSPNGRLLASGSEDRTVKLWDVGTHKVIHSFDEHQGRVTTLSFSQDGERLASVGFDKTVKLWDVNSGQEIATFTGHQAEVTGIAFHPSGRLLASASGDSTIKLWDINTDKEINDKKIDLLNEHCHSISTVIFSPLGEKLAAACGNGTDGSITLWNIKTHKEITTLKGHNDGVLGISFDPSGRLLASGSWDETVKLWDVSDEKMNQKPSNLQESDGSVLNVSFNPSKRLRLLASATWNKTNGGGNTIKLWNIDTYKQLTPLEGHKQEIKSLSFNPSGQILASTSDDKTIKLWNVNTHKEIDTLEGHSAGVQSVNFSPNSKLLASASSDKTIRLWDVNTHKEIEILKGHRLGVSSIDFNPNSKLLASASSDKTIRLWNVNTHKEINLLNGRTEVNSVNFSPNGKWLASGGNSGQVILWNLEKILPDMTLDNLLVQGCDWVRDYLQNNPNVEERDRHLCDNVPKVVAERGSPYRTVEVENSWVLHQLK